MIVTRRGFMQSILALGAAPAIVRADSLMRVVPREKGIITLDYLRSVARTLRGNSIDDPIATAQMWAATWAATHEDPLAQVAIITPKPGVVVGPPEEACRQAMRWFEERYPGQHAIVHFR
jgi:hypothetical protein